MSNKIKVHFKERGAQKYLERNSLTRLDTVQSWKEGDPVGVKTKGGFRQASIVNVGEVTNGEVVIEVKLEEIL